MEEILNLLKKHSLFSSLNYSNKKIKELLNQIQILDYNKNTIIYEIGQPAQYVYMVISGEVGIYTDKTMYLTSNNNTEKFIHFNKYNLMSIHGKGSIFGEVSLLAEETHSSTAITITKTKILIIPKHVFSLFIESDHQFAMNLIHFLSSRFRQRIENKDIPQIGKILCSIYPDIPIRNFIMLRYLSYTIVKEIHKPVILIYFQQRIEKDDENQKLFQDVYSQFNIDQTSEFCIKNAKYENVIFLNAISILKSDYNEHKLIDFLAYLRRHFSIILIETPSLDFECSQVFLRISEHILFFHRYGATSIALKELYLEQLKQQGFLDQENKIIFIYEKSIKEKTPYEISEKNTIYYIKTFIDENLEPQEDKSTRRLIRILLNRSRALTLGGGGARAFAHVGCLEVFDSEQIEFDAVIGSSMGAVIGSLYAMGLTPIEIRKYIQKYLSKSDYVFDKNIPVVSFFKGNKLNTLLNLVFKDIRIEELEIPFYCTATDLTNGKLILFERGFLDFALRCSVGLPGVYPPIKYGEHVLIDGSVLNNLPGEIAKNKGYNKVLGINVTPPIDPISSETELKNKKNLQGIYEYFSLPPILSIINRSISIQGRELLKYQQQFFNFILNPDISAFGLFDFHHYDKIIEKGHEEAKNKLSVIKKIFLEVQES